jgi:hypothetical protein
MHSSTHQSTRSGAHCALGPTYQRLFDANRRSQGRIHSGQRPEGLRTTQLETRYPFPSGICVILGLRTC